MNSRANQSFSCNKQERKSISSDSSDEISRYFQEECHFCQEEKQTKYLYTHQKCDKSICQAHFNRNMIITDEFHLPCGCTSETRSVVIFLSQFCFQCGTVLPERSNQVLDFCSECRRKVSTNDQIKRKDFKINYLNSFYHHYWKRADEQEYVGNRIQTLEKEKDELNKKFKQQNMLKLKFKKEKQSLEKDNQKLHKVIKRIGQTTSANKLEIKHLNNKLKVSCFTRDQIKNLACLEDKDVDCPICLQKFHLKTRKPMMVCLQQHLICQKCLQPKNKVKSCPFCRDPIPRKKVSVSRQKIKYLQFEQVVFQKYEDKVKEFQNRQCDVVYPYLKNRVHHSETQTDPIVKEVEQKRQSIYFDKQFFEKRNVEREINQSSSSTLTYDRCLKKFVPLKKKNRSFSNSSPSFDSLSSESYY